MKENSMAKVLNIIGEVIIVCGVIASFIIAVAMGKNVGLAIVSFFSVLLASIVSGSLFLGFAEIINLLQLNVFKTEKLIKSIESKYKTEE